MACGHEPDWQVMGAEPLDMGLGGLPSWEDWGTGEKVAALESNDYMFEGLISILG